MSEKRRGRLEHEVSFEGVVTAYLYDDAVGAGGRLVQKKYWPTVAAYSGGAGTPGEITKYTFDAFGRQTEVVQDRDGNLATTTDQRATTNAYDTYGRLASVVSPEGTVNYEYDAVTGVLKRTYTGLADPTRTSIASDGKAVTDTRYDYDWLGRLTKVTAKERNDQPLASPEATDYVYDLLGNLKQTRLPNGVVSDYDYDSLNRLERLRQFRDTNANHTYEAGVDALLAEYDYDLLADGKRSGVTETDDQGRSTRIDWLYDVAGRLTRESYNSYDPALDFLTEYTLDLAGNRRAKSTDTNPTFSGDPTYEETIASTYDANDRLLTEIKNDLTASNQDRYTVYSYGAGDTGTQQTAKTVREGLVPGGQLKEQATDSYNLQGRMSGSQVDAEGNGSFETTISYEYDDSGIRVSQTVDGTKTLYLVDGQNPTGYQQVLEEKNASGGILKSYLLGLDVIAQALSSGAVHFLLYDGHGSTRALVDAQGNIITSPTRQVFAYDAYGLPIGFDPANALTSLLYSGEQLDRLTNLQYLRARYYDLATGRFNTFDPFAGVERAPQTLHRYAYALDDPIGLLDPSGNFPSFFSLIPRSVLGTYVHTFLSAEYERSGTPHVDRWGNRYISTIARDLGIVNPPRDARRPDMAGLPLGRGGYPNIVTPGEIYGVKPGEILTLFNPGVYMLMAAPAVAEAEYYQGILSSKVPAVSWSLGASFIPGIKVWRTFNRVATDGFYLVTFNDYLIAPGAILWDFVPTKEAMEVEALAGLSIAAAYVYLNNLASLWTARAGVAAGLEVVEAEAMVRPRPTYGRAQRVCYTSNPNFSMAASIGMLGIGLGLAAGSA